jgi:hypothetical protein
MLRHTVRATRVVVGLALLLVGVVLSLPLVPGPGFVFVLAGLTMLGYEFAWARRLRDRIAAELGRLARRRHAG